jgi:hypothetical protein
MGSTYEADGELVVNDAKRGTLFSASNERVPAAARAEALRGAMYREQMKVVDAYKKELAEEIGPPPPAKATAPPTFSPLRGRVSQCWLAGYM